MKNLIKPILLVLGVIFGSASFAQTSPDSTHKGKTGKNYNEQTYPDSTVRKKSNMDMNRSDSTRMNDRRKNPSNMPSDSTRTRMQNDKMMLRDSVNN